jgi:hypothetical protein
MGSKKSTKSKKVNRKQSRMPKGRILLPPLSDNVHLSNFGYSLHNTKQNRQSSLKKASKKHGTLKVLKRTNLIANYSQWNKDNYKKLRQDVEFLKKEYATEKKVLSRTSKKKSSKKAI